MAWSRNSINVCRVLDELPTPDNYNSISNPSPQCIVTDIGEKSFVTSKECLRDIDKRWEGAKCQEVLIKPSEESRLHFNCSDITIKISILIMVCRRVISWTPTEAVDRLNCAKAAPFEISAERRQYKGDTSICSNQSNTFQLSAYFCDSDPIINFNPSKMRLR